MTPVKKNTPLGEPLMMAKEREPFVKQWSEW
jgi:hypothetical protein